MRVVTGVDAVTIIVPASILLLLQFGIYKTANVLRPLKLRDSFFHNFVVLDFRDINSL